MPKKSTLKPAEQVLNTNLVNKNGMSAGSNAADSINVSKIRCHVCSQVRSVTEYSNRQLQRHQNTIYNPYIPGGRSAKVYATCKWCTASQTEEIQCFHCGEVKPLKKFLKTQRSQAKPRCKGCVQYCLDVERNQETPHLDDYTYDSSDESDVDDIFGVRREEKEDNGDDVTEGNDEDAESDEDVDAPKEKQGSKARVQTPSLIDKMTSMNLVETPAAGKTVATHASRVLPATPHLLDDDEGWQQVVSRKTNSALRTPTYASLAGSGLATPAIGATPVLGTTSATPNQSSKVSNTPHLLDDDDGWQKVQVAGKTNSAFRTPTYASRAASGLATPAMTSTAYSVSSRTTTSTPATTPGTSSGTSTTGGKWGKPAKPNAGEVVEDVWKTKTARRNNWTPFGGQPKMVIPKPRKKDDSDEDEDCDDDDE